MADPFDRSSSPGPTPPIAIHPATMQSVLGVVMEIRRVAHGLGSHIVDLQTGQGAIMAEIGKVAGQQSEQKGQIAALREDFRTLRRGVREKMGSISEIVAAGVGPDDSGRHAVAEMELSLVKEKLEEERREAEKREAELRGKIVAAEQELRTAAAHAALEKKSAETLAEARAYEQAVYRRRSLIGVVVAILIAAATSVVSVVVTKATTPQGASAASPGPSGASGH